MSLRLENRSISLPAYAKVNLYLDITGKRADGYHTLNSVMQRISLCDTVTVNVKSGGGISVSCDNPTIPNDERNIAYKAADAVFKKTGLHAQVSVCIEKHIPTEAGLGGSSADGAAVLVGLNKLLGNVLNQDELEKIGAGLGADVPFCIRGGTAVCTGIGDEMESVKGLDESCCFVLIKPEFSCNTGKAYKLFDEKPMTKNKDFRRFLTALDDGGIDAIGAGLYNVFEELYEDNRIYTAKRQLADAGACGACLSGSGSAVFGIFQNKKTAQEALNKLNYPWKYLAEAVPVGKLL